MRIALVMVLLAGCSGNNETAPPDASTVTCGSGADTENGGDLYACAIGGEPGLCTTDSHGAIGCYPTCSAQLECFTGSAPYVLQLRDASRVCFCLPNA